MPRATQPPAPTVQSVLDGLAVSSAPARVQLKAVAEAAYAGRLSLAALKLMKAGGFLPYDVERTDAEHEPA